MNPPTIWCEPLYAALRALVRDVCAIESARVRHAWAWADFHRHGVWLGRVWGAEPTPTQGRDT